MAASDPGPASDPGGAGPGPRALDPDELRVWIDFLRVATYSIDLLDRELVAAHDLHLADYEIFVALSQQPGQRLAMSALAQRALLSASRLTYRLDRLVAAGYVERQPCHQDGRRTWAILTEAGRAKLDEAYPVHLAGVRRYLVDPAAADLDAMQRTLTAMLAAIGRVRDVPDLHVPDAS